jgi:enoyl-CoA hydratase
MPTDAASFALVTAHTVRGVAVVTLRNPKRRNALSGGVIDGLMAALREVERDSSIGCLLLCAEGPAFCSGAYLSLLHDAGNDPTSEQWYTTMGRIYQLFATLGSAPVPTIAAVGGAIVGAGVNLASACDLRIVADDLRLVGFGPAKVHPGGGHLRLLDIAASPSTTAAVALFHEELDADAALRSGFAWRSVPRSALDEAAMEIACRPAADPALTRELTATLRAHRRARSEAEAAILLERAPQLWSLRRRP